MIGLEIFNTFILLLLVVAATASLWVKDLLVSAVVLEFTVFLCAYFGRKWERWMLHLQKQRWVPNKHGGISATVFHLRRKSND